MVRAMLGWGAAVFAAMTTGEATARVPVRHALRCDSSIQRFFKPDALTSVIAVKAFRKGRHARHCRIPDADADRQGGE